LLGDAKTAQLKERLERLLQETAEVEVEWGAFPFCARSASSAST
jgi:hypothetical protein